MSATSVKEVLARGQYLLCRRQFISCVVCWTGLVFLQREKSELAATVIVFKEFRTGCVNHCNYTINRTVNFMCMVGQGIYNLKYTTSIHPYVPYFENIIKLLKKMQTTEDHKQQLFQQPSRHFKFALLLFETVSSI